MTSPLLKVERLTRQYRRGIVRRKVTFSLSADFEIAEACIVGVMGPNGSGKTTLFELITGGNRPDSGRVLIEGQDIHQVRAGERDRLAIHYHQSYQIRAFSRNRPNFLLERAHTRYPLVHLFDEPQFNTQDGYIGFMLDFFRKLRAEGRLVFLCLHPNEPYHLELMRECCERYLFVHNGVLAEIPDFATLIADQRVRAYLGALLPDRECE
ncbi:MAG: ATP-binding cassette domain-containing protein [Betaproteobacteria bacterium]